MLSIPLVEMGLTPAVTRQFVKKEVDTGVYLSTGMVITIINSLLLSIAIMFCSSLISKYTLVSKAFILLAGAYSFFHVLSELLLAIWRMEDKPIRYGVFRTIKIILDISLSLHLIIGIGLDWEGRAYGMVIACVISGVAAFFLLWKSGYIRFSFRKDYLRHLLAFGLPVIPHTISGIFISYSDKLIITNTLGVEESGVYSVAFTIGMALGLLVNSFNQAWAPWLYQKLESGGEEEKIQIVKITYVYFLVITGIALLVGLCAPVIYKVIGQDFAAGSSLVIWVALGFAFNGMYKMVVNYLFYAERTMLVAISSIIAAGINIFLNLELIPVYGIKGAAIATLLAFMIQFTVVWFFAVRVIDMPWLYWIKTKKSEKC
jgi:O-antigen/teichoic acid export membrane protein